MNNNYQNNMPSKKIISIGKKIITIIVSILETRLKLIVIELEKEKIHLIRLLIKIILTIMFAAFSLLFLIILIILIIDDIKYRIWIISAITVLLIFTTLILSLCIKKEIISSSLLYYTRKELKKDLKSLND